MGRSAPRRRSTRPHRPRGAIAVYGDRYIGALLPDHPGGLLLRPAVSVPIEIYTEARIAEFAGDEVAIGRYLPRKRARAPRSKTK